MRGHCLSVILLAVLPLATIPAFYGHITRDTTWADTVNITGDVVVDSGVTLTIKPGTQVRVTGRQWDDPEGGHEVELSVRHGRIDAQGTREDPIVMDKCIDGWNLGCLRFHQSSVYLRGMRIRKTYVIPIIADSCPVVRLEDVDLIRIGIGNGYGTRIAVTEPYYGCAGLYVTGCDSVVLERVLVDSVFGLEGCPEQSAFGEEAAGIRCTACPSVVLRDVTVRNIRGGSVNDYPIFCGLPGYGIQCLSCGAVTMSGVTVSDIEPGVLGGNDAWAIEVTARSLTGADLKLTEICSGYSAAGVKAETEQMSLDRVTIDGCKGGYSYGVYWRGRVATISSGWIMRCLAWCPYGPADAAGLYLNGDSVFINRTNISLCVGSSPSGNAYGLVWNGRQGIARRSSFSWCTGGTGGAGPKGRGIGVWCRSGRLRLGGTPADQCNIVGNSFLNVYNQSPDTIIATHNWWGITDPDSIGKLIYDYRDDPRVGWVIYEPWANSETGVEEERPTPPSAAAPVRLSVSPTIGRHFTIRVAAISSLLAPNSLLIYDATGRIVETLRLPSSSRGLPSTVTWDASHVPAGVYFIRLGDDPAAGTHKVLVR